MSSSKPNLIVLGGPNGAGKSTTAATILVGELAVAEFVNADQIAAGMSDPNSERTAIAAGRIMLERIATHAGARSHFAIESTLASRTLANVIGEARASGYRIHLVFLWLDGADLAVARVLERVRSGGHSVPEATIRRRYRRGIENFFELYRPLADAWRLYDNSGRLGPRLVARGGIGAPDEIIDESTWRRARSSG